VTSSVYPDGRDVPHHLALGTYVVFEGESDYARRCFKEYAMLPDSSGRYAARLSGGGRHILPRQGVPGGKEPRYPVGAEMSGQSPARGPLA